jgi:hypothetical protein
MRKVDPADVRADFELTASEVIAHFNHVAMALTGTPNKELDVSQLATQSFLTLFVAFERFLSDLILAYLNRDSSVYQTFLVGRINASIADKFGSSVKALITIQTKKHISVAELEGIVDPEGWNLTFSTVEKLKSSATAWLVPIHAVRINSITSPEVRLIETSRAIRDFIAHQSSGSKKRMNECLSTIEAGVHNRHLGRGANEVHTVGSYLKAIQGGQRRLHRYAAGLLSVSSHV